MFTNLLINNLCSLSLSLLSSPRCSNIYLSSLHFYPLFFPFPLANYLNSFITHTHTLSLPASCLHLLVSAPFPQHTHNQPPTHQLPTHCVSYYFRSPTAAGRRLLILSMGTILSLILPLPVHHLHMHPNCIAGD